MIVMMKNDESDDKDNDDVCGGDDDWDDDVWDNDDDDGDDSYDDDDNDATTSPLFSSQITKNILDSMSELR